MLKRISTNQTKTMLLLMLVFTVVILLFSALVYFSIVNFSHQRFYELLKIRATTIVQIEKGKEHLDIPANHILNSTNDEELPMEKDYVFEVPRDSNYSQITSQIHIPDTFFKNIIKKGEDNYNDQEFYYIGQSFKSDDKTYIAIASAKNHYVVDYLGYLKRTLVTCMVLAIFFSMIFSFYLSKTLFKPILKITGKVKEISSENLHLRLEPQPGNTELNELIDTFNDMLNRIETSFETQNHLIGNVSHELRTPLTSIMGEADVALSQKRSEAHYQETLQIILDEAEKLDKKIKALLMIAQTGFDGKIQKMDKVRMDQLLWDVIETAKRINSKNNVYLDISMLPDNPKKLKVQGNEQLLHLAMANIINNGCKYSNFQQVKVSLGATDDHVYIIIKDHGIGIPDSEMDKIYDPFYRASNTKNYEGYGIGLPLARNIVRIHNGELIVNSKENVGTTVQIRFPIYVPTE
ncbi:Signal transduction histidine kinase [Epilithonimonas bovis DSM 19482]|jgi:signal transduction histidine kinase|uniref:histidine kinase n=1 Tax=Epilithonimonas bovis DSM 19482 TaxID=1121284 RepID=A0A1U7PW24_9FLAO|nr:HAMP domain-containing sensor histidine kinase [Epilithonimonas bovis]MDN5627505.1 HAMP domain-containing histidine kinase [Weeksellaceae bacterium]SIT96162.1 Signal transduction histidine kinase [Epilithonimonas bovis DSM 19482]